MLIADILVSKCNEDGIGGSNWVVPRTFSTCMGVRILLSSWLQQYIKARYHATRERDRTFCYVMFENIVY